MIRPRHVALRTVGLALLAVACGDFVHTVGDAMIDAGSGVDAPDDAFVPEPVELTCERYIVDYGSDEDWGDFRYTQWYAETPLDRPASEVRGIDAVGCDLC